MRISVIGCGYVGLVVGLGFCELGNEVRFVDVDEEKVKKINLKEPPFSFLYMKDGNRVMYTRLRQSGRYR